jgi:tetratricopeptide (TPR) repeat protein
VDLTSKNLGPVVVSIIRFASNLIPPLRRWVKKTGQRYAAQASQAHLANDLDLAEDYFLEALVWQGENAELHSNLGQVYYEHSKSPEAETQFRKALDYDYRNLRALKGLGLLLQEREELSEAMYLYLKYLESDPRDPVVCHNLGAIFHNLGDYETAIEYYQRAEKEDFKDPLIRRNLALALLSLGKPEEAKTTLLRARESAPQDAEVDRLLGSTLEALGEPESAWASYESALKKDPQNAETHLQLSALALVLDHYQDAVSHAQTAADLFLKAGENASAGEAYWELGWSYCVRADWEKALEASSRALELNPGLTPVHFNVGLALLQLGRAHEARNEYSQGAALAKVSELKEHGIDDLKDALDKKPDLVGAQPILEMLEDKYRALSQDVAKAAQSAA